MSKDNDPEETEYEVDKILKVRINPKNNKREFLVKWQRNKRSFFRYYHKKVWEFQGSNSYYFGFDDLNRLERRRFNLGA